MGNTKSPVTPTFVQASFRLQPDTLEAIRSYATSHNCSQSEAMRSSVALLKHNESLPDNVKLATVDVNQFTDDGKYKVVSWIIAE